MKNFKYPGVRRGVTDSVVPEVPKNCIVFIFKLKLSYKDQVVPGANLGLGRLGSCLGR